MANDEFIPCYYDSGQGLALNHRPMRILEQDTVSRIQVSGMDLGPAGIEILVGSYG